MIDSVDSDPSFKRIYPSFYDLTEHIKDYSYVFFIDRLQEFRIHFEQLHGTLDVGTICHYLGWGFLATDDAKLIMTLILHGFPYVSPDCSSKDIMRFLLNYNTRELPLLPFGTID